MNHPNKTQIYDKCDELLHWFSCNHKLNCTAEDVEELTDEMKSIGKDEMQLSFFKLDDPLLIELRDEILETDIDTLTPVEALMKLNEIKRMLQRNASVKLKK